MSRERAGRQTKAGADGTQDDRPPTITSDPTHLENEDEANNPYPLILHPTPLDAYQSSLSLLRLGMPGLMSLPDLRALDLDTVTITLGRGQTHEMQDLVSWTDGSDTDGTTIKGKIAEFAACVGPEVVGEIVVDFSRD